MLRHLFLLLPIFAQTYKKQRTKTHLHTEEYVQKRF